MPVKTANNMESDELVKIRHILGTYRFKKGGWCRLGEFPNGNFFIEQQLAGEFQSKCIPCEPEYLVSQKKYFDTHPREINAFERLHPELTEHFTKTGKPKTDATILEEFLESKEGAEFKPNGVAWRNPWFEVMQKALDSTYEGKQRPKLSKPFSFKEWANNKNGQ